MALIICKECGKEISDQAKNCPHCGCPVIAKTQSVMQTDNSSVQKPKKKGIGLLVVVLVVMFGLIGLIQAIQNPRTSQSPNTDTDSQSSVNDSADKQEEPEPQPTSLQLAIGDTITTDASEITINKIEFSYDVLPDNVSGFYSHYEADAGNVYIHIDADVKNIGKQNLRCDEIMFVSADYNDGYSYNGFAVPEDSNTGFTYDNITSIKPLETLGVRFLIECPQEVEETDSPLELSFEPNSSKDVYTFNLRN